MRTWGIGSTRGGDVFDIGITGRDAEPDDVCANVISEPIDARASEGGGSIDGTATASLVTVGQQDHRDGAAGPIGIPSEWARSARKIIARGEQRATEGCIASRPKFGVVADTRARAAPARIIDPAQDVALVVWCDRNQHLS